MVDHGNQQVQQRLAAQVLSVRGLMAALAAQSSRFVSRQVAHTVNVKQPKRSKQAHPWRLVDPKALGEFPPLEGLDLPE